MLERYVWMMENSVDSIHIRHVNALIQLIRKYIAGLEHLETEPPVVHEKTEKSIFSIDGVAVGSSAGQTRLPIAVRRHFDSILAYLENVKRKEHRQMEISGGGVNGFGTSRRKWSELQI
ncbi:hypothetical protein BC830DRAFT_840615 [Chytriomyces sp. MP71]|nr:hypothetical protein BC830DRAFT_840615 [Chytriomyces sp. MP71]